MQSVLILTAALAASNAAETPYQGVLLEFSATWCGPCRQMSPLVERLERQGFPIRKVDVDREKALARKYRITSIPAFVLVVNGKEVSRQVGRQSESQLKRLMAQIPRKAPQTKSFVAETRNDQPEMPADPPMGQIATADPPKRGLFSGIKLPSFNSKREQPKPPALGDSSAIFRGKYGAPNGSSERTVRVGPMAASTRIRIKDSKGLSYGSGTIIESRPGQTLILTCGHIFRELTDDSLIEVDVFDGERAEKYVGKVLRYNLEADVGLISIASDVALPHVDVAKLANRPQPNESVFSIGCGGGDEPTRQNIRVTQLNPYLGPECLECTGVPIQGRSGGGLFNKQGEVIGVCFASDAKAGTGLYAGLQPIHDLLNDKKQDRQAAPADQLAKNAGMGSQVDSMQQAGLEKLTADAQTPANEAAVLMDDMTRTAVGVVQTAVGVPAQRSDPLAGVPQGAEVICIIRSHENPRETSRVVIINRASPKFLSYLRGEMEDQPKPTTARRPMTNDEPMAAESSPAIQRTAHFVEPRIAPVGDKAAVSPPIRKTQQQKTGHAATPRWRATRVTPTLPSKSQTAPQRYRRSTASRR